MMQPLAFTSEYKGRVNRLITPCAIAEAFKPDAVPPTKSINGVKATALWDTGATISAISSNVVKSLNLIPFNKKEVFHAGGDEKTVFSFQIPSTHKYDFVKQITSRKPGKK